MLFETETSFVGETIRHLVPPPLAFSDTCLSTPCQSISDGKPTVQMFWFELDLEMVFDITSNNHSCCNWSTSRISELKSTRISNATVVNFDVSP